MGQENQFVVVFKNVRKMNIINVVSSLSGYLIVIAKKDLIIKKLLNNVIPFNFDDKLINDLTYKT